MEYKHRVKTTDALRRKQVRLLESDPELFFDMRRKPEQRFGFVSESRDIEK